MQRFAFEQAAPTQALQQYGNIVAGNILPGTITTSGQSSRPSFLQGAAGGAAAGASIGGAPGAVIGGLLGGLFR
jgi:hypothetical protein